MRKHRVTYRRGKKVQVYGAGGEPKRKDSRQKKCGRSKGGMISCYTNGPGMLTFEKKMGKVGTKKRAGGNHDRQRKKRIQGGLTAASTDQEDFESQGVHQKSSERPKGGGRENSTGSGVKRTGEDVRSDGTALRIKNPWKGKTVGRKKQNL